MHAHAPSILLAEDDPITREVIVTHLSALGCSVTATAAASEAIALGGRARFDALLLDCALAGGDADTVVRALRADPGAPNARTPAIAISAELGDDRLDALLRSGFADAIQKPIGRDRLRLALVACAVKGLAGSGASIATEPLPASTLVLDEAAGLAACGSIEVLRGLRQLLAAELPTYRAEIDIACARGDVIALQSSLHRLKSALGFCGAAELRAVLEHAGRELPEPAQLRRWQTAIDRLAGALPAAY
jgi:CheY-like chemotaxis protein